MSTPAPVTAHELARILLAGRDVEILVPARGGDEGHDWALGTFADVFQGIDALRIGPALPGSPLAASFQALRERVRLMHETGAPEDWVAAWLT